jgi:integrase
MSNYLKGTLGFKESTVHSFRSSFRDWAGETTGHSREVIEQSLAHSLADHTEAAYQRGDYLEKRRALMSDWARHLQMSGDQTFDTQASTSLKSQNSID